MQVYEIRDAFGLENLQLGERPQPQLKPGQILIEVKACSLNYRDWLTVLGQYNPRQPLPLIPLSDGAGQVTAIGEGVHRVGVGDRVAATFAQGWIGGEPTLERFRRSTLGGPNDGMLAQCVALDQDGVVVIPDHLSYEQAATLACAGLTAWTSLNKYRPTLPGETVLLQGTGGVSIFALQFAKLLGATVILTSSSDDKLQRARAMGADHLINYREVPDWSRRVREITGKRGVDRIVEVGGAGTFEQSLKAVRMGGFIATVGVLAGAVAPLSVLPVLMSGLTVQGIQVGNRDEFEAMNRALSTHPDLLPVVDKVFAFDQVHDAFSMLRDGRHFGKIVIRVAADS